MNPNTTNQPRGPRRVHRAVLIATATLGLMTVPLTTPGVAAAQLPIAAQADRGEPRPGLGQAELAAAVTDLLGLPAAEVGQRLRDGQSLAEIADAEGVARQDLIVAIEAAIAERLDEAVAADRITAEEREMLEGLAVGRIDELIDRDFDGGERGERGRAKAMVGPAGEELSDLLGLPPMEVASRLRGGDSLAEIAQAEGVDDEALVATVDGLVDDLLDRAVAADRISVDEREALEELADGRIEWLIDRTRTAAP